MNPDMEPLVPPEDRKKFDDFAIALWERSTGKIHPSKLRRYRIRELCVFALYCTIVWAVMFILTVRIVFHALAR